MGLYSRGLSVSVVEALSFLSASDERLLLKEEISMEENNSEGKRKSPPSIPANYISILQLKQRWINEKESIQKEVEQEEAEKRMKEQRIEEDLKKEVRGHPEDLDERRHWGINCKKKESTDGGEAKFADKGLPPEIIVAAVGSDRVEDATEGLRGFRRKRYISKKKKNQHVALEEDIVECVSIVPPENNSSIKDAIRVNWKKEKKSVEKAEATGHPEVLDESRKPLDRSDRKHWRIKSIKKESTESGEAKFASKVLPPEIIVAAIGSYRDEDATEELRGFRRQRCKSKKKKKQHMAVEEDMVEFGSIVPPENNTPMKDAIRVNWKKGKKTVESLEKTVTAIESKFENLSIKKGETNNLKAQTSSETRQNQRHHLPPQRVRMQKETTGTMVWVKKEPNARADDDIGSGGC